ncbi:hypothetical protein E4U21_003419 [Claviceps maximensis]|nr:hypothetical protein E4U21_003419 [Claviceps maximensis]
MSATTIILSLLVIGAGILYRRCCEEAAGAHLSSPTVHSTWFPILGPIFGIRFWGFNAYTSALCATQRAPIATLKLPGQEIHLIHPMHKESVRIFSNMQHVSLLAVFYTSIGPALGLQSASERFLTQSDDGDFKRGLHRCFNSELRGVDNLRKNAARLEHRVYEYCEAAFAGPGRGQGQEPGSGSATIQCGLGSWLFDMLSCSMGAVFWGGKGPFGDVVFRDNLRLVVQNLPSLGHPFALLIPAKLRSARAYVRDGIERATRARDLYADGDHAERGGEETLFVQLTCLYASLEMPRDCYVDCHLSVIVGLMSNIINLVSWAFCHVLADVELQMLLKEELYNAGAGAGAGTGAIDGLSHHPGAATLDFDRLRSACPLLMATWYELLRVYADAPIVRRLNRDSLFGRDMQLRKGSVIVSPIHLRNYDEAIWGQDTHVFRPDRFLRPSHSGQAQGRRRINEELVTNLVVFGLPGMHQCPGRHLGLTMALTILAKIMVDLEIRPRPGDGLERGLVPHRTESMLGLPALSRDPEVTVRRAGDAPTLRVGFGNLSLR